jgi:cytochrome c oxidase subunit 2
MNWLRSLWLPPQGSAYAAEVDRLFLFLVWMSIFFFTLVAGLAIWSVIRYRRRPGRTTPHITDHLKLELTWSIIPLVLVIGIFFWGMHGYMEASVAPNESLEITVTAKKWVWQFEYPDGTRTLNELHVPVNRPVRFLMSSEDVIHSFYVPDMRVKMDVLPNRYTELWFEPTAEGLHRLTCAEYCGKGHSDMAAKIWVDSDAKYKKWLEEGGDEWKTMSVHDYGALLYENKGCATCHSLDGSRHEGPTYKGIFGHTVTLADGKQVKVDENYLRESMLDPAAKVVAGFEPIMPTFQGMLREREIKALIEFIKAQK